LIELLVVIAIIAMVHADGSANRTKGFLKETDWFFSHSYVGWDANYN
jgi:hypothetical protein